MTDVREETHVTEWDTSTTVYDPRLPNGFLMFSEDGIHTYQEYWDLIERGIFRQADGGLELTAAGVAHFAPAVAAERRRYYEARGLHDDPSAKPQGVQLL